VNGDAEVATRNMFGDDSIGLGSGIDPVQAAVRQRRTSKSGGIRGELNAFDSVCEETFEAGQAFQIRPYTIGTQIDKILEI
jgi:hypothetical protein